MKETDFVSDRVGKLEWVDVGIPSKYYRFQPKELPFDLTLSDEINGQLEKTMLALGRLDGMGDILSKEEIILLQRPFWMKEAKFSSEIEGTRSTITDVFKGQKVEETNVEKRLDNQEIINYLRALEYGLKPENRELNEELIKKIHKTILEGVRGSGKNPGEYKTTQNAVGNREDTLDTAKFVPASPESTPYLMKNLLEFINSPTYLKLYKIAVAHYQFESIHPFRDGNGRIGRLLIILQLCKEEILKNPLIYISEYFTRNRDTYTEALYNVSSKGEIENWIIFFLKALEYQALRSTKLLTNILNYKNELYGKAKEISGSRHIHSLIDLLFREPIILVKDVMELCKITQPAARKILKKLISYDIVRELQLRKRQKVYIAQKIINIIDEEASTT